MKALTIFQPYATLIAAGRKRFETRSWKPPLSAIGQTIAIHAGLKRDRETCRRCVAVTRDGDSFSADRNAIRVYDFNGRFLATYPVGAIVGSAKLNDAGRIIEEVGPDTLRVTWIGKRSWGRLPYLYHKEVNRERQYGDLSIGRWMWDMFPAGMKPYPIPATGRQGIWEWNP